MSSKSPCYLQRTQEDPGQSVETDNMETRHVNKSNPRLPLPFVNMFTQYKEEEEEKKKRMPYLEVKTVEQFRYERKRGEEDLQRVDVCSMSLTQVDRSLQVEEKKECREHFFFNRRNRPEEKKISTVYLP